MSKFRCIIADDEPLALRLIRSYVERIDSLELVGAYESGAEVLSALTAGQADIAILDIQMPHITGIEIARAIAEAPIDVIFVTAYRDYAFEGFRVHAADYLLKPVSYEEFAAAIERVTSRRRGQRPQFITVRSDYRSVRIAIADILYVEGLKDYVKIYTADRERPIITQMSMKSIEGMLPEEDFVRVHRSYIVSPRHVSTYDRSRLVVGNTEIPVGDTYRARVIEKLNSGA